MLKEEFDRSKIYEKLEELPEPLDYQSNIPWNIQQQIAATNGIHYKNLKGKLKEIPEFELPVKSALKPQLMLDIGCGWGRWLMAANKKNYIPIGIDLRLEFCQTANNLMKENNVKGYNIVADLENLPFKDNVFDLIWSFSVIQHTHIDRLFNCLKRANELLTDNGYLYIEMPNRNGIRNRIKYVERSEKLKDEYNSWVVRYYSIEEYKNIFSKFLNNVKTFNHSFIGIGVLKEDLKYVNNYNKLLTLISLTGSLLTKIFPPLIKLSDSLYIKAEKKKSTTSNNQSVIEQFMKTYLNNEYDNLHVIKLIKCPKYGGDLVINADRTKAVSKEAGIYYPIEDDIPILIASEAISM